MGSVDNGSYEGACSHPVLIINYHRGTKDISEDLFDKSNQLNLIPPLFIQF